MTQRKIQYWVIPPEADFEFVANMENVLETYAFPYDPKVPVLCLDEQPVQLTKEVRVPIAATKNHARRMDYYEYERAGTACIFMFTEPLAGWREATVRERRTKIDWATEMARLLLGRYAHADRVILVCDNLNTHTMGAFSEAFPAAQARDLVRRIEFRFTPKHGSWLNISENELSSLTKAVHPWAAFRKRASSRKRSGCMEQPLQRKPTNQRLAIHHQRRSDKTKVALSQFLSLTKH